MRKIKLYIKKIIKKLTEIMFWNIIASIFKILPLKKKTIYFESFLGRYYSDNPKALYEYMIKEKLDYNYVWGFVDLDSKTIVGKSKKIRRMRLKYLFYISTSKYIVNNSRMPNRFKKRKNQVYIQTWHGTPLKKLVYDMENVKMPGTNKKNYLMNFSNDISQWDYLISPNDYATKKFKSCFRYGGKIIESGYPRNDVLKYSDSSKYNKIKNKLKIPKDKKVILYTPTFRDDEFLKKGHYIQKIMFDFEKIKEKYPDYVFLLRNHYLIKKNIDFYYNDNPAKLYMDVSKYEDISELYLISDILITDYSSTFFDFSILNKPIIFYQYDHKKYKDHLRDFYIEDNQLPSKPVYTEKDVMKLLDKVIKNGMKYQKGYRELHIEEYYNNSSEHIIDSIFKKKD